jgi:dolichol-phosphate mannosyltransferase
MASQQPALMPRGDSPDGYLLSIVIPCFNEEEVIGSTYNRIIDSLNISGFQLQLIFVNDGSKDRTGIILQSIAAADSRVEVVNLSRNFGHQAAVSAGLNYARGDVTAIIDADLQDPPEVIPQMIDRWREGYNVVYGIRRQRKEARWKRFCYSLFYRLQQKMTSIDAPPDAGDFSLIDRRVLAEINRLPEKNRFFRGLRAWIGFAQIGVEYERAPRAAGVTKYPFLKLLKLATDGIFNFSTAPLTVVFFLGMAISLLSFVALVTVIFLRISDLKIFGVRYSDVQGFSSTIVTILFIGGVQLVCTGILGEYIGRIYQEVKARPYFIAQADPKIPESSVGDTAALQESAAHQLESTETANSVFQRDGHDDHRLNGVVDRDHGGLRATAKRDVPIG